MKERANIFLHWIDRHLGIIIVFLLRWFHKKRPQYHCFDHIACLKLSGIGDTILLSAVICDIQKAHPRSKITLFVGENNAEIASWISNIEVISLPITQPLKCIQLIRKKTYDVWIDFDSWPRINALFSYFSLSHYTIGFQTPNQYRHYLYDHVVQHQYDVHEIENYRNLVRAIRIQSDSTPYFSFPTMKIKKQIVLHLFSSGSKAYLKEWPMVYWRRLILLLQKHKYNIAITGSKNDSEKIDAFISTCTLQNVENKAGLFNLQELARFLKQSSLCISIDTGIAHLAASIDVPTLVIHGPTSPKHWGAIGKNVLYIQPTKNGSCIRLGFDTKCKANICMQNISPEKVYRETLKMLSMSDSASQSLPNSSPSRSLLDILV